MDNITFRGHSLTNEPIEGDFSSSISWYGEGFTRMYFIHREEGKFRTRVKYQIHPESLSMSTGMRDKNGKMIFGSVPVDGKMSRGGDRDAAGNNVQFLYGGFCLNGDRPLSSNFEITSNQWEAK